MDAAGTTKVAVLRGVTLGGSGVNFSCIGSDGADLAVEIRNCRIVDSVITAANGPLLTPTGIGLRFRAVQDVGSPPVVAAEVNNLTVTGTFSNLSKPAFLSEANDLQRTSLQGFSRLIEVYAFGQDPVGFDHSLVTLDVNGGILEGGATPSADGWDIGIYSALHSDNKGTDPTIRSETIVSVTGASLSRFVEAGIYGTARVDTRGQIILRGKTEVSGTGDLVGHVPGEHFHSGVHLYNLEGYMGLSAADSYIHDNTGSGVILRSSGTDQRERALELGMPLAMRRCVVAGNLGNGIELESGVDTPISGHIQDGIVGGTMSSFSAFPVLLEGSMGATVPYGQGVIDRCAVSNNGERGIRAYSGEGGYDFVYCRISNSFIWNNPLGGFVGDFSNPVSGVSGGVILTPIHQCTLAANGGASAPYSIEFLQPGGSGAYHWQNPTNGWETATELVNTIFDRGTIGLDFGPALESDSISAVSGTFAAPSRIAVGGIRRATFSGLPAFPASTTDSPCYVGPISLTDRLPNQFFLSATGNPSIVDAGLGFQNVAAPETLIDYLGDTRTDPLSDFDKGAEEL